MEFQIDQLRKDKMVYALESIALTFIVELSYVLVSVIIGETSKRLAVAALLIPLGYFFYMVYGNMMRFRQIKELEEALHD